MALPALTIMFALTLWLAPPDAGNPVEMAAAWSLLGLLPQLRRRHRPGPRHNIGPAPSVEMQAVGLRLAAAVDRQADLVRFLYLATVPETEADDGRVAGDVRRFMPELLAICQRHLTRQDVFALADNGGTLSHAMQGWLGIYLLDHVQHVVLPAGKAGLSRRIAAGSAAPKLSANAAAPITATPTPQTAKTTAADSRHQSLLTD